MTLSTTILLYIALHTGISSYSETVNEQRTIVGFINSAVLSSMAGYPLYLLFSEPTTAIHTVLSLPQMTTLGDILLAHFTLDLLIGHLFDRKRLDLLEGYIHHILYTAVITYIGYTGETNIILLYLPFEIPTVFLNLNRLTEGRPYNLHFGVTFVIFRLLYNIWLIRLMTSYNPYYMSLTCLMLAVHSFWFYKWSRRYLAINTTVTN